MASSSKSFFTSGREFKTDVNLSHLFVFSSNGSLVGTEDGSFQNVRIFSPTFLEEPKAETKDSKESESREKEIKNVPQKSELVTFPEAVAALIPMPQNRIFCVLLDSNEVIDLEDKNKRYLVDPGIGTDINFLACLRWKEKFVHYVNSSTRKIQLFDVAIEKETKDKPGSAKSEVLGDIEVPSIFGHPVALSVLSNNQLAVGLSSGNIAILEENANVITLKKMIHHRAVEVFFRTSMQVSWGRLLFLSLENDLVAVVSIMDKALCRVDIKFLRLQEDQWSCEKYYRGRLPGIDELLFCYDESALVSYQRDSKHAVIYNLRSLYHSEAITSAASEVPIRNGLMSRDDKVLAKSRDSFRLLRVQPEVPSRKEALKSVRDEIATALNNTDTPSIIMEYYGTLQVTQYAATFFTHRPELPFQRQNLADLQELDAKQIEEFIGESAEELVEESAEESAEVSVEESVKDKKKCLVM